MVWKVYISISFQICFFPVMLKLSGGSSTQQLHTMLPQKASIEFHDSSWVSWWKMNGEVSYISVVTGWIEWHLIRQWITCQKLLIFNRKHEEIHSFGPFCGASIRQIFEWVTNPRTMKDLAQISEVKRLELKEARRKAQWCGDGTDVWHPSLWFV